MAVWRAIKPDGLFLENPSGGGSFEREPRPLDPARASANELVAGRSTIELRTRGQP